MGSDRVLISLTYAYTWKISYAVAVVPKKRDGFIREPICIWNGHYGVIGMAADGASGREQYCG